MSREERHARYANTRPNLGDLIEFSLFLCRFRPPSLRTFCTNIQSVTIGHFSFICGNCIALYLDALFSRCGLAVCRGQRVGPATQKVAGSGRSAFT